MVVSVVVLYLWRGGVRVAKHTYRYSSARLRSSGRYLCYHQQVRRALQACSGAVSAGGALTRWKRRLCRFSGLQMAATAVNNLGCRHHRYGKPEHHVVAPGGGGDHFRRKLMSRKSMPCLNGALPHLKRSVSWGELVHLSDERCSTVLKQYNHRVSSLL